MPRKADASQQIVCRNGNEILAGRAEGLCDRTHTFLRAKHLSEHPYFAAAAQVCKRLLRRDRLLIHRIYHLDIPTSGRTSRRAERSGGRGGTRSDLASQTWTTTLCGGEALHFTIRTSRTKRPIATPCPTSPPIPAFRTTSRTKRPMLTPCLGRPILYTTTTTT